jgi:hypothetical protein
MAFVIVVVVLLVAFIWWFRRTPTYRSHRRRIGVVPGQHSADSSVKFYGGNPSPSYPELLEPDDDSPSRHWWRRRSSKPDPNDAP